MTTRQLPKGVYFEIYMHNNNPLGRDEPHLRHMEEDVGIKLEHNAFKVAAEDIRRRYKGYDLESFTALASEGEAVYYDYGGLVSVSDLDSYIWILNNSRRRLNRMARKFGLPKPKKE